MLLYIYNVLFFFVLFINTLLIAKTENKTVPIVLWHGMGDSCCNPLTMGYIIKLLKKTIPGVYVNSLKFGNNIAEDTELGFFANMNKLVNKSCKIIKNNPNLQQGFHIVGFSQGGLFARALTQRCSEAKVLNLISIGSPQQGIYGFPYCYEHNKICDAIRYLINYNAYETFVQKIVVQAQYWHDPFYAKDYAEKNLFLADLNCENIKTCNPLYKTNLLKVKNFVLVKFLRDTIVVPKESEWFGFYPNNSISTILPMEETELYKKDLIGIKTLKETNRLHFLTIDGQHLQIHEKDFLNEIVNKFLKNV